MTSLSSTSLATTRTAKPAPPPRRSSAVLGLRITVSGLLFVGVLVFVGLAALNSEANQLLLLFGIGVGALLLNAGLSFRTVRRIDVERVVSDAVIAGRPFTMKYVVRYRGRRMRAWSLVVTEMAIGSGRVRFPQGFVACLDPGGETRPELTGLCPQRGRAALRGIRVRSRFPFGLAGSAVDIHSPCELTVYPTVGRLRCDPFKKGPIDRATQAGVTRDAQSGDEFYGIREYREGDNLRWIHWRRSAHTGELVVREMAPLRQTRLIVMLDPWPADGEPASTRAGGGDDPTSPAEQAIRAAATMICDGLDRGHRVGLICRSAAALIAPGTGRTHRHRLLEELASIAPGGSTPLVELVARVRWSTGWHARCLILPGQAGPECEQVIRFVGGRAEAVLMLAPGTESFDAVFAPPERLATARRAP